MNIDGKWEVSIISGPWWFRKMRDKDTKYIKDGKGYNRIFGWKWGRFEVFYDDIGFTLRYKNKRIIDRVWFINKDFLRGNLYLNGKSVGTFSMKRKRKGK